jgi:tripartite-type tricarboxylate transporter receptor subunit TctC
VDTGWKAGRVVPICDLEIGGGFYSPCGTYRATVGYVFSAWGNVVKTQDWIQAVQTNSYNNLGNTMTFDGLVARIEARF